MTKPSAIQVLLAKRLGMSPASSRDEVCRAALSKLAKMSYTWTQTSTGYRTSDGRAELIKSGKRWTLVMRDGTTYDMPARPSFDHAEAAIIRHGAN